jgi:hypothetical protein
MAAYEIEIPCMIRVTVNALSDDIAVKRARDLMDEAIGDANSAIHLMNRHAIIEPTDDTTLPWIVNGTVTRVDSIA